MLCYTVCNVELASPCMGALPGPWRIAPSRSITLDVTARQQQHPQPKIVKYSQPMWSAKCH